MAYQSNIAAMNAAKAFMKQAGFNAAAYKEYFKIEKLDGEWHAQQTQPFPAPRDPLSALLAERDGIFAFPKAEEANAQGLTEAQSHADALANAQQSESLKNGKLWVRISSIAKPVRRVWDIADEMNAQARAAGQPAPSRKAVQEECVRRGIASGTARTQYQAWKKACDEAAANAAHAAELSAAFNKK